MVFYLVFRALAGVVWMLGKLVMLLIAGLVWLVCLPFEVHADRKRRRAFDAQAATRRPAYDVYRRR